MAGEWDFGFDIREACPNRVKYLREAVDMLIHNYPDVYVVDNGAELGPCFYRTIFSVPVSNPEDSKEVAMAVTRANQFIRDVAARLEPYGWRVFEKESYVDGNNVYTEVRWIRRVRLPNKRNASLMDIYELVVPYIKDKYLRGAEAAALPQ
jgi:hypothetical protein